MAGALKLEKFGGMLPAWSPRLLPEGQAASSTNGYLFSGELQPWRKPKLLRQLLNSSAKCVFRIPTISEEQAFAYAIFTAQPSVGDTLTIGEDTYKFVSSLPASGHGSSRTFGNPFDVLIGANTTETSNHLLQAVTADFGTSVNIGVSYGSGTVQNGAVFINATAVPDGQACSHGNGFNNYDLVQFFAPDFGAAYNITPVSVNSAAISWSSATTSIIPITTFVGGTNASFNNIIDGPSTWLEFDDPDTDVAKSQVTNDAWNRYYFCSPSLPPQYNTYDRIVANQPPFLLGINPPGCAPNVSVTGGGNSLQLPANSVTTNGSNATMFSNNIYLVPIVPTGATYIQDVSFMPQTTNSLVRYAALIFADANQNGATPSAPGALLDIGEIATGTVVGTTAVSSFVNPTNMLAETPYWIGIMIDSTISVGVAGVSGGPISSTTVAIVNTFSNGPPSYAPTPSAAFTDFQMWADCQ